jgi:hypothetical protein
MEDTKIKRILYLLILATIVAIIMELLWMILCLVVVLGLHKCWWIYDVPSVQICGRHRGKSCPKVEHIGIISCGASLSIGSSSTDRSPCVEPKKFFVSAIARKRCSRGITNVAMKEIAYTGFYAPVSSMRNR